MHLILCQSIKTSCISVSVHLRTSLHTSNQHNLTHLCGTLYHNYFCSFPNQFPYYLSYGHFVFILLEAYINMFYNIFSFRTFSFSSSILTLVFFTSFSFLLVQFSPHTHSCHYQKRVCSTFRTSCHPVILHLFAFHHSQTSHTSIFIVCLSHVFRAVLFLCKCLLVSILIHSSGSERLNHFFCSLSSHSHYHLCNLFE